MKNLGISTALLAPLSADGQIDLDCFAQHARSVLDKGAVSVTIFGTTGEGASVSAAGWVTGRQKLVTVGIPPASIIQAI